MAWWEFWRRKDSLDLFREVYGSAASAAGVEVNSKTALQCGVAVACARVIGEGLSQVPFRLMQSVGDQRNAASSHPLFDLLDTAPNEFMTAPEFFDTIGLHLVFAGNAFIWKNKVRGRVAELLPFEPRNVEVSFKDWRPSYKYRPDEGAPLDIPADEMWHIRGPSMNGWFGIEGVKIAREAIGLAMTAEEHASVSLANASAPAGLLTTDQNLTAAQRAQLRESWVLVHGGRVNRGRMAVMSNGMKFVPISSDAESSQLIETRRMQVEEVCRNFRVMPIMVGYSDKASTYASAEQMFLAHVVHTMSPWYRRIEKSAAVSLLTERERKDGHYFKFFAQALLRGASNERSDFYTKMVTNGLMSPNECRELEDLNPYPGGEKFTRQINMGSIAEDGSTQAPEPAAPAEPVNTDPGAKRARAAGGEWTDDDRRHAEQMSVLSSIEDAMRSQNIIVNVPELKQPSVHFHAPEQPAPTVVNHLHAPDQPAPVVNVNNDVKVDPAAVIDLKKQADKPWPTEVTVQERDDKGRPARYVSRPIE